MDFTYRHRLSERGQFQIGMGHPLCWRFAPRHREHGLELIHARLERRDQRLAIGRDVGRPRLARRARAGWKPAKVDNRVQADCSPDKSPPSGSNEAHLGFPSQIASEGFASKDEVRDLLPRSPLPSAARRAPSLRCNTPCRSDEFVSRRPMAGEQAVECRGGHVSLYGVRIPTAIPPTCACPRAPTPESKLHLSARPLPPRWPPAR